ncbi:cysteine-rich receptor-like protein kinase 8 [Tanacetum coccineum]|uniref:Cysteine-rich receptor-like protein kinase 8 n=1 Tax=Tanacetum coccineum TaxID=301880 RepID=A0ABQ4XZ99_9ASTR
MDLSNPLYIHPSDGLGSLPIQEKLIGAQNYRSWRRFFEIGLSTKRKLGFVKGTVLRPPIVLVPPTTAAMNAVNTEFEIWTQLESRFSLRNGLRKYKLSKECFDIKQHGNSEESQKDVFQNNGSSIESTEKVGYPVWHHKYKQNKASNQFKPKGDTNAGNFKKTAASVTSGASNFTFTSEQFKSLMRSVLNDMKNCGASGTDCTNDDLEFVAAILNAKILKILPKITLPNGQSSEITQIGHVKLNNGILLKDVLCVPEFKFSLLSIPKLTKDNNCVVIFFLNFCVLQDLTTRKVLGLGKKIAGLYHLLNVHMDYVDGKIRNMVDSHISSGLFSCSTGIYKKPVCTNMFSLWHHRLGHLPDSKMKHIQCNDVSTINETGLTCLTCLMAKLTRLPFSLSDSHSSTAFHLIHMDTWGPYKVPTNGKYRYFLTIVDDFSRATWTYLMVNKSDAFAILKTFLKFVEMQFNAKVKCIRSDNALEFVKGPCASYLADQGIEHQTTCVDRPQQNGRAERKHRHILEVARALRFQATLPLSCFVSRDVQFHEHIFPFVESSTLQFCQPMPVSMPNSKVTYDDPVVLPTNVHVYLSNEIPNEEVVINHTEDVLESSSTVPIRKSSRQTKPPDWTKDFC